ncbi:TetR/AcrR family transcriptional regulator [Sphingoaurantiacus capsulatus]|uniref:TetR/AcrR family transcriptional regulator n=1 Tax=Sphingoaurantiacus capsulatus TaxID=1771310 RepID=A0ABV7XG44_9SPHN
MSMTAVEREQFRAAIRAAALPLFLERPIADLTLKGVAEAMGASFWAVYRQYETREVLYRAAVAPLIDEVAAVAARTPRTTASVGAAVGACVRHAVELMQGARYRDMFYLLLRDGAGQDWIEPIYRDRIVGALVRGFEAAVRRAGDQHGLVIGIQPGTSQRVIRTLESNLLLPRLLPNSVPLSDEEVAAARQAAVNGLMAATYAVEFAEPAAA